MSPSATATSHERPTDLLRKCYCGVCDSKRLHFSLKLHKAVLNVSSNSSVRGHVMYCDVSKMHWECSRLQSKLHNKMFKRTIKVKGQKFVSCASTLSHSCFRPQLFLNVAGEPPLYKESEIKNSHVHYAYPLWFYALFFSVALAKYNRQKSCQFRFFSWKSI